MDPDLRLGHIAVRMGAIRPQDLPQLMREARVGIPDERGKPITGLGQVLLKRGLISVDDYLYMARQVSEEQQAHNAVQALEQVTTAWSAYESGELDREQFEEILGRSGEPILRPTEPVRSFGPYTLEGEVARGGMGIVYRARDPSDRIVALKVMINADDDEVRLRRFEREAELAAALEHPNVVSIHDAGRIDGIPYFTMDLIEGEPLEDLLEEGVEPEKVIEILIQVARGLSHAHERGVVHRDLKPGNILVDKDGCAHITDFGLARDLARLTRLTAVGQAVGTPYYMAPEQVRGERDVDGRCDIYAAGVILYEALTGEVPFDADTPLTLFRKIDADPVVLELDESLGIDANIRTITLRALAKEREDRYPDAVLLADDLERYQQGLPPRPLGNDFKTRLLTHRLLLPTLVLALLAVISAVLAGSLLWSRHQASASFDRGKQRALSALEEASELTEQASRALSAKQPEAACDHVLAGLARLSLDPAEGAETRGVEEGLTEGGAARVVERLHRLHLQAWVARTASDGAEFPLALRALEDAREAGGETSPEQALYAGILLTRAGRPMEALPLLDLAVDGLEQDPAARLARARTRIDLGQHLGAASDLSKILGEGEASSELLVLRGRAYLAQRRLAAARADAQRAHDIALRDPAPLLLLGDVAREQDDVEAARAHYRAAGGRDAKDPRVHRRLAELAWRSGEPTQVLGHLDAAAAAGGADAPLLRTRALLSALDFSAARVVTGQVPSGGTYPRDTRRALSAWHQARAELALAEGRREEAWSALQQALSEHPRNEGAALWAAELALRDGGGGVSALRRVVEAAGSPPAATAGWLLVRARLAAAEGEVADARELAGHAEKFATETLRPSVVALLAELAEADDPEGHRDATWLAGLQGHELCATLTRDGRERVALAGARASSELSESGAARLRAALELDPRRVAARVALAGVLANKGDHALGLEHAARAVEFAAGQPELARVYANLALGAGEPSALDEAARLLALPEELPLELRPLQARVALAREAWSEALRALEPLDGEVAALRAEALRKLGREDEAQAQDALAEAYARETAARDELSQQAVALREAGESVDRVIEVLERAVRLGPPHDAVGLQLRLRLAATYREPRARLESLEGLLCLSDPGILDAADQALVGVWQPLEGEAQQDLLRRARRGALGPRLGVALAAAEDALAGLHDAGRLRLGRRHARAGLLEFPGSFTLHVVCALLDARLGFPYRARARLELVLKVDPDSSLARYALAEALAGCGDGDAAEQVLRGLREADPGGPWTDRRDRSPVLGRE